MSKLQLLTIEIFVPEDARNRLTTDKQVMAAIRHLVRRQPEKEADIIFFLVGDKMLRNKFHSAAAPVDDSSI